jgi:hypothetical protein
LAAIPIAAPLKAAAIIGPAPSPQEKALRCSLPLFLRFSAEPPRLVLD